MASVFQPLSPLSMATQSQYNSCYGLNVKSFLVDTDVQTLDPQLGLLFV